MPQRTPHSRRSFLRSLCRASLLFAWVGLLPRCFSDSALKTPILGALTALLVAGNPLGVSLVDIAREAGLHSVCLFGGEAAKRWIIETTGCGIAFFDFDRDGWPDIFQVNGSLLEPIPKGQEPTNHLYKNNRDGTFTDVTEKAGLTRTGWGQGVCVGDYDNDGWDELFVTYWGQNVLYRNNGDGTFTDVTTKAGLLQAGPLPRWNTGCAFVDYDKDGFLDLFVANYVDLDLAKTPAAGSGQFCQWKGIPVMCGPRGLPSGTNLLYHNNGDGTFQDVSQASGVGKARGHYAFTALTGDFNNDGWPDIYVACDSTPSLLFRNNKDGTFTDVAVKAGCAYNEDGKEQAGMGAAAGDYNADGWLDIFKTNFSDDTSSLYSGSGDGNFIDATLSAGLGKNTRYLGWGCGFVDIENDGWLDIFLANGHVYPEIEKAGLDTPFREPKVLYRNLRNGRFEDVSAQAGSGVSLPRSSRGVAFGDFDNDGDMDIVINNIHDIPTLLRNNLSNSNRSLLLKLTGVRSNRSAIGTRVRVVTASRSQTDEVRSGGSYISQNDLRLHFGTGSATEADLIEIHWPSGLVEKIVKTATNQQLWIEEGMGIVKSSPLAKKG